MAVKTICAGHNAELRHLETPGLKRGMYLVNVYGGPPYVATAFAYKDDTSKEVAFEMANDMYLRLHTASAVIRHKRKRKRQDEELVDSIMSAIPNTA